MRPSTVQTRSVEGNVSRTVAITRIVLIEDDPRIREVVERGLTPRGFSVASAGTGAAGIELVDRVQPDVVLLDLMLPDRHGLEILEELRNRVPETAVIALTALDDTRSKVGGLDAGADDYVTKPFAIEELAARIRARVRRSNENGMPLSAGPISVDPVAHRAFLEDREIELSGREMTLLATFIRHKGQVLTRGQLLKLVWDIDFDPGSNVVDVHVAALRRKLGSNVLETIRGVGYRLVVPGTDREPLD